MKKKFQVLEKICLLFLFFAFHLASFSQHESESLDLNVADNELESEEEDEFSADEVFETHDLDFEREGWERPDIKDKNTKKKEVFSCGNLIIDFLVNLGPIHESRFDTEAFRRVVNENIDFINQTDSGGDTALIFATQLGFLSAVKILLKHRKEIDIDQKGKGGRTALHNAVMAENPRITRVLMRANCSTTISDKAGHTVFFYAKRNRDVFGTIFKEKTGLPLAMNRLRGFSDSNLKRHSPRKEKLPSPRKDSSSNVLKKKKSGKFLKSLSGSSIFRSSETPFEDLN